MMSSKKYYYFPPFRPQFYFPKKKFKQFTKFYEPFSFKAKLFWFVFLNIPLAKEIFIIRETQLPKHFRKIIEILDIKDASVFFNTGTPGPEQKITAIAKNNTKQRFIKFGETDLAMRLIQNEVETLRTMNTQACFKSIPKVIDSFKAEDFCYLVTNVINGEKLKAIEFSPPIFEFLTAFQIKTQTKHDLYQIFSHGDFCPWNIIVEDNGNIVPVDWEMASLKTLGYDLFTYIFHTNFLLFPQKRPDDIIKKNKVWIEQYFHHFNVKEYDKYLLSFVTDRLKQESKSPNQKLYKKYQQLYALYG